MRLFISIPIKGRADADIDAEKSAILERVKAERSEPVEMIDSYVSENAPVSGEHAAAWYLGEAVKCLATVDAAYFADRWEKARGCRIERAVCEAYDIPVLSASKTQSTVNAVNILGTKYSVEVKKYADDEQFKKRNICGYCDSQLKRIVICDPATYEDGYQKSPAKIAADIAETKRHEIVHAFFDESGLGAASLPYNGAWARNEEMVDWWAIQGPKVYEAWREAGAV